MSNNVLTQAISKAKANPTPESKQSLVSELINSSLFVPVIVKADNKKHITNMSYYSIKAENGSFLLVFSSIEEIGHWRKDVQFMEVGILDVCSILNIDNSGYVGVEINHGSNSIAFKKEFIDKLKEHIVEIKKN